MADCPRKAREAYRLLGQIAGGEEPRLKRKDLTDKPMLNEVAERFLAEYSVSLKPASYEKYRFLFDRGTSCFCPTARPDRRSFDSTPAPRQCCEKFRVCPAIRMSSSAGAPATVSSICRNRGGAFEPRPISATCDCTISGTRSPVSPPLRRVRCP